MNSKTYTYALGLISSLMFFSHTANAVEYLASIGGPVAVNGHTTNVSSGDGFLLETLAYSSYSCEGVPS